MEDIVDTTANWQAELEAIIQQFQSETVKYASVGLGIAAMVVLQGNAFLTNVYLNFIIALSLIALAILAWFVQRYSKIVAVWLIIISGLAAIFTIAYQSSLGVLLWLTILPAGLATLTLGFGFGVSIALGCSALIWFLPDSILVISSVIRVIAILGIWGTVGMLWLTVRPLLTVVQFAWRGYEKNRDLLEKTRNYQVKLQETLEDLTNANKQLTRMTQQAEALRQVAEEEKHIKERFVANVSHELRTPLNMIIGFCEMITQEPDNYGGDIPQALLADLTVVLRNSQHLSSLINDVLDLSQLDAGRTALSKERISLSEIIQAAVVAVRPLYESKNLYLKMEIPGDLPLVFCDRTRIREVILNLLSNAGRFTSTGGVRIEAMKKSSDVEIRVIDTGPGIAGEHLEKLFQPFEQLQNTVRRQYGGTGLGLSISKRFVELHGGTMKAESQVGTGTTFSFTLPIDPPLGLQFDALRWFSPYHSFEPHFRSPHLPPAKIRPHFLVIEKRNSLKRILDRYLNEAEVTTVETYENAGEILAQIPAQAVLINALEVSAANDHLIASDILPQGVPALIFSVPSIESTTSILGVSEYLLKPVSQNVLYTAIEHLGVPVKTVLVIDDDSEALQLFGRMLMASEHHFRVLRADNGEEALEIMSQEHPDLILLDLMMPNMDGFQFLAAKEKISDCRTIPVIVVTANDPQGQPIASKTLMVTCRDGLSVSELLECIEALIAILSKGGSFANPVRQAESPG